MCAECPSRLARDLDSAYPEFVRHHQDLVFGMARRMTPTGADAEDLAQETFIRAYRALGGYDRERVRALRLRGWLATIATNIARNRARRRTAPTAGLDAAPEPLADANRQPEAVAERRAEARAWRSRLARLSPRQRRAVELRHVDGLSYPELAEALGRPVGTVKSDVHRGVARLREILEAEGEPETAVEGST